LASPSAVATATTNINVATTITINAPAAVFVFTNVNLCFCHYRHHRFCMCHSHHDHHFCHSCCCFLVDCYLTHHCHCFADAIANATTNATTDIHCLPKPLLALRCCCFNHCHCATGVAGATFVLPANASCFALAGCYVAYSCATSLPLDVLLHN
jgi:hypothetical protein